MFFLVSLRILAYTTSCYLSHLCAWGNLSHLTVILQQFLIIKPAIAGKSKLVALTWNLPVSALAWASVQGQSVISLRKLGSWVSSLSHAKHLSRAQTVEFCRNLSSRCQARAWSSVHTACTLLNETHDKHIFQVKWSKKYRKLRLNLISLTSCLPKF